MYFEMEQLSPSEEVKRKKTLVPHQVQDTVIMLIS